MKKIIILPILFSLLLIGASCSGKTSEGSSSSTNTESITETPAYFNENSAIMYFYSDECSWCIKEKENLNQLYAEGYNFKPMNVGKDPALGEEYKIEGFPTFIAKNGDKLIGYQEIDSLREWLKQHIQ